MSSVTYRLSEKVDSRGKAEILLRVIYDRQHTYRLKSHIFIRPERWDERRSVPMIRRIANAEQKELLEIKRYMEELSHWMIKAADGISTDNITRAWAKAQLEDFWSPGSESDTLLLYDDFIKSRDVAKSTMTNILSVRHRIEEYIDKTGNGSKIKEIDLDFLNDFQNYLLDEPTYLQINRINKRPSRKKPRSKNSVHAIFVIFRSFIIFCQKKGVIQNDPFANFTSEAELYGTPYYLTIEERDKVAALDLSESPKLEASRDAFIFQCFTGLRHSDLCTLRVSDISDGILTFTPQKTKRHSVRTIQVPLARKALDILNKYHSIGGRHRRCGLLLPVQQHNMTYNHHIKEILRIAGIDRLVSVIDPISRKEEKRPICDIATSHIARRTFIGNLYKKIKDPNIIGSLSGHVEGSRAFARYREIDIDIKREAVELLED